MNKKDLIKYINEEADKVEVKNFSQEILARAQTLPQEKIIYQEPKRKFYFNPIFQMSFVTIVGLFIMMFILQPTDPIYAFEEQDQVFASSAIASLSYLDANIDELSQETSVSLSSAVDDELDDVVLFAELSERLLSNYEVIKTEVEGEFKYQLSFQTTDLLDETENYVIRYNETRTEKNTYRYEGEIEIESKAYAFSGEIKLGLENEFNFEIIHDNHLIDMNYMVHGDAYLYQFNYYKDQVITQKFDMKELNINNQKHIMVDFKTTSKGIYTFKIEEQNQMRSLKAQYRIQNGALEDGEITITPNTSEAYQIEIRPRGMAPIIIERGRRPHMQDDNHPGNGRM
jgi:hypothetical protein